MKKLSNDEVKNKILSSLSEEFQNEKIVPIIFERISKWNDIKNMERAGELDFFSKIKKPQYDKEKLVYKSSSTKETENNLKLAIKTLSDLNEENFTSDNIKISLMKIANDLKNRGELLHPVRYALSGKDKSPDPFIIAEILGKNETLSRLQKAV